MSHSNYTSKSKFSHLNFERYQHIELRYNHFLSSNNKSSKTIFMQNLALEVGTSRSNLYDIIKSGLTHILNYDLSTRIIVSASKAAILRKPVIPNNSKLLIAKPFIDLVTSIFFSTDNIASIDEIVNDLRFNYKEKIAGMSIVCTKTIYNYIHNKSIDIQHLDCPQILKRKPRKIHKQPKRQKGTSIDERPFGVNDRSEFGHWEGDLVVMGFKEQF